MSELSRTFTNEQLLLAHILRFPEQVKPILYPALTPDKFIYDESGQWGNTHRRIYRLMEELMGQNRWPNIANVVNNIGKDNETIQPYLASLLNRLERQYKITEFDEGFVRELVEQVDKAGMVWQIASRSRTIANVIEEREAFDKEVEKIKDVDEWASRVMDGFNAIKRSTINEGYMPVSNVVEEVRELLERQRKGEQQLLLPCGLPSIYGAGLGVPGELTVVHGASGSGKSMVVHTLDVGTALGLKRHGLKGVVAINSIEMTRTRPVLRWLSMLSGVPAKTFMANIVTMSKEDYNRLQRWLDFIAGLPIVVDDSHFLQFDEMKRVLTTLHLSSAGPVRQQSIDYLELFSDSSDSEELRLSRIIRQLQNVAHEYDIHIIVISQTTYQAGSKITLAGPTGTRYSRAIQHAADNIIEVFNPKALANAGLEYLLPAGLDDEHLWLVVEKRRNDEAGQRIALTWQPECLRVLDPRLNSTLSNGAPVVFEHLMSVAEVRAVAPKSVPDPSDTAVSKLL